MSTAETTPAAGAVASAPAVAAAPPVVAPPVEPKTYVGKFNGVEAFNKGLHEIAKANGSPFPDGTVLVGDKGILTPDAAAAMYQAFERDFSTRKQRDAKPSDAPPGTPPETKSTFLDLPASASATPEIGDLITVATKSGIDAGSLIKEFAGGKPSKEVLDTVIAGDPGLKALPRAAAEKLAIASGQVAASNFNATREHILQAAGGADRVANMWNQREQFVPDKAERDAIETALKPENIARDPDAARRAWSRFSAYAGAKTGGDATVRAPINGSPQATQTGIDDNAAKDLMGKVLAGSATPEEMKQIGGWNHPAWRNKR